MFHSLAVNGRVPPGEPRVSRKNADDFAVDTSTVSDLLTGLSDRFGNETTAQNASDGRTARQPPGPGSRPRPSPASTRSSWTRTTPSPSTSSPSTCADAPARPVDKSDALVEGVAGGVGRVRGRRRAGAAAREEWPESQGQEVRVEAIHEDGFYGKAGQKAEHPSAPAHVRKHQDPPARDTRTPGERPGERAAALRERPYELLMTALYRCGRQAEALGAYDRARRRLVHDLGTEPGPELRGHMEAILHHRDPHRLTAGQTAARPAGHTGERGPGRHVRAGRSRSGPAPSRACTCCATRSTGCTATSNDSRGNSGIS
ncbi:BTAD domain-containing putative transcriptional regulator [Streptomyces sp. NPDC004838]